VLKLIVNPQERNKEARWTYLAQTWGINEVCWGVPPWLIMGRHIPQRLPALVMECDNHPYEVLGTWYGESNIQAVASNPPQCRERNLSKQDLEKAKWLGEVNHGGVDSLWLPGMQFHQGQYKPKCGRCATPLKTKPDGSLGEYRCPWCGLTAFVDPEGVAHCMLCGNPLCLERDNQKGEEQALCPFCSVRYFKTQIGWQGYHIEVIQKGDRPE